MSEWAVGLSTGCFYRSNILECLELIRESGFSLIEVCSSPSHLDYHDLEAVRRSARRITDLGMTAYSFHAPFADHIDISSIDAGLREAALKEILCAVEAAAILQVSYLVIHPGPENAMTPPPHERFQRMENVVETLDRVARHCKNLGIGCVLENKLPHLLFGKTSDILWILDALNAIEVGACLDTGHAYLSSDIFNLLHKLANHLKMVHVHDNRGHFDDHLPPGDGAIDWRTLLRKLTEARFHGPLILEMAGAADANTTLANARRGRSYLRNVARQLTLSTP
ncbi:MAG: sugar phosphate isomerase/epimerase [Terrimicrobiaceae bacterium]